MKILVLNAHPGIKSLSSSLAESYSEAAKSKGHEVVTTHLRDLKFDPILHEGYKKIQDLEPDLQLMQEIIKSSNHLVIVTPVWWGGVPALLKGFFDRILLPGFAFKYRENSPMWDKLLKGRTAKIIVLSDGPVWWNRLVLGDPIIKMLKKSVLEFCGFKTKVTVFGNIKNLNKDEIDDIINKVRRLGNKAL